MRKDVYSSVTERIVSVLEKGVKPWTQPWNAAHAAGHVSRPLRHNGQPYRGINILMLWASAMERAYAAPIWMTYKQAKELGGFVRKGEGGAPVVYADTFTKSETEEGTGGEIARTIPFMKGYTVFNVDQIDGLPSHYYALSEPPTEPIERIADAEAFFSASPAVIRHGGDSAFYNLTGDYIQLPILEAFRSADDYYATKAHELTHWTRHPSRLDRDMGRKRFGDEGYAREELVAELGAAFICADLGLKLNDREDHAAYIESWLQVLKNDKRAIFAAASHAQRAADYLHNLQDKKILGGGRIRASD